MKRIEDSENKYADAADELKPVVKVAQNLLSKLGNTINLLNAIQGALTEQIAEHQTDFHEMSPENKENPSAKRALEKMQARLVEMNKKAGQRARGFTAVKEALTSMSLDTMKTELIKEAEESRKEAGKAKTLMDQEKR